MKSLKYQWHSSRPKFKNYGLEKDNTLTYVCIVQDQGKIRGKWEEKDIL